MSYLIFFIYFFCINSVYAKDKSKTDGFSLGVYEKGTYIGIFSILNDYEKLELGVNYFDTPIGAYDLGFSEQIRINFSSIGAKLNYRRYFQSKSYKGFYTEASLELNKYNLDTNVDLSRLLYKSGNVTFLCPSCDTVDIYIKPKRVNIIPTLSIGWGKKISKKLSLNTSIGIQYIKINKSDWQYNSNSILPFFVRNEIERVVEDINSSINNLPVFYPSASISLSYYFN